MKSTPSRNIPMGVAFILICLGFLLLSGCSTPEYRKDRLNDAADIITVSFGWGAGVRARVGPVNAGLLSSRDIAGIRGGRIGRLVPKDERGNWALRDSYTVDVILSSLETFNPDPAVRKRGKSFSAFGIPLVSFPSCAINQKVYPYYYYSQVEAMVALGPSVRLGVNPGEFVDFLMGWFRIDIFNDDSERPLILDENDNDGVNIASRETS